MSGRTKGDGELAKKELKVKVIVIILVKERKREKKSCERKNY